MNTHLFVNEMRLQCYEMRQYWFETLSGLIFITGVIVLSLLNFHSNQSDLKHMFFFIIISRK